MEVDVSYPQRVQAPRQENKAEFTGSRFDLAATFDEIIVWMRAQPIRNTAELRRFSLESTYISLESLSHGVSSSVQNHLIGI